MRTAFLGTSEFAAAVLRGLAGEPAPPGARRHPARQPRGRGRQELPPPAAEAARELGIELAQTADVNAEPELERIRAARPEAVVVCAFGQLIREPLLSELPLINVHPSLLPRWRGAAPIERAIMAGDERDRGLRDETDRGPRLGPGRASRGDRDRRRRRLRDRLGPPRGGRRRAAGQEPRPARGRRSRASRSRTTPRRPTPRRSTPPSGASIPPARRSSWPERSAP